MTTEVMLSEITLTNEIITPIIAGVLGIFGGAIIEFINKFMDKDKADEDMQASFRKELREELVSARDEVNELSDELDVWKEKYFEQVQLTNKFELDILMLERKLEEYKRLSGLHDDDNDVPNHNGWFEIND